MQKRFLKFSSLSSSSFLSYRVTLFTPTTSHHNHPHKLNVSIIYAVTEPILITLNKKVCVTIFYMIWTLHVFNLKNFWAKNLFGSSTFWSKIFFESKIFWLNIFWTKLSFSQKNFLSPILWLEQKEARYGRFVCFTLNPLKSIGSLKKA